MSLLPSAELATATHVRKPAFVCSFQVTPESDEV